MPGSFTYQCASVKAGFVPASSLCLDKACCPRQGHCARVLTEVEIGPLAKMSTPDYSKLGRSANVLAHALWGGAFTLKVQHYLYSKAIGPFNKLDIYSNKLQVNASWFSTSLKLRGRSSRARPPWSSTCWAGGSAQRWPRV